MKHLSINYEWYNIHNSNFLVIHKSGSQTILNNFECVKADCGPNPNLITWAVIRNPLERFISGLAYDIRRTNRTNFDSIIKNPEKLLFGEHNGIFKQQFMMVSHTYMQSLYFLNEKIHIFVRLEDLEDFIRLHTGSYITGRENKTNSKEKEIALEIIDKIGKERISDLFYIENKIYDKIINSELVWNWQYGNIFTGNTPA